VAADGADVDGGGGGLSVAAMAQREKLKSVDYDGNLARSIVNAGGKYKHSSLEEQFDTADATMDCMDDKGARGTAQAQAVGFATLLLHFLGFFISFHKTEHRLIRSCDVCFFAHAVGFATSLVRSCCLLRFKSTGFNELFRSCRYSFVSLGDG
jgi:hypothetical protein